MNLVQHIIIGRLVQSLLDDGYRVVISDQDGGGLFVYAVPDNGDKTSGYDYWVRMEPANAEVDFIVDYSTNLTGLVEPLTAFIETVAQGA